MSHLLLTDDSLTDDSLTIVLSTLLPIAGILIIVVVIVAVCLSQKKAQHRDVSGTKCLK